MTRLTVLLSIVLVTGCTGPPKTHTYAPPAATARNPIKAQQLTQEALPHMQSDPARAEKLLREALVADLYHGPAHNNLGVLYLNRSDLYEASHEFEWARKLMPGHPDPRLNLAMTLERAGRVDEALATYDAALEVYPNHLPSMQGLCRCQLRHGKADDRTREMLQEIALRGETEAWRAWARGQTIRLEG